jgi:RimJ/RimL family protein N-acetyltransferase
VASPLELPRLCRPPVLLRAFTAADAALVAEASTDALIPLITTVPASPDATSVQAFIDRQRERAMTGTGYSFVIADAGTDQGLGQIGLWPLGGGRASVGYWVAPSARRRRVATRALALISDWAWGLPGLARLELYVEPWNEGSWRAAETVGYQREGLLRSWQLVGDERRDMYMYALLEQSS